MMEATLRPLPMEEAEQFWKSKVKLSPGEFAQIAEEAKIRAFTVSGIARGNELTTVFQSLQQALSDGISFDEFKKDCREIFERRGWTGKRAWRVDNIFRTNIQTAYGVGHYKQLTENQDLFPYWQYSAINDSRTRPTHRALDGRVYPADHSFWDKWYPPNGYRCRCSVVGIRSEQIEQEGLRIHEQDPTGLPIEPISPVSGEKMISTQLLFPDEGFDTNPGKEYWGGMVDDVVAKNNLFKSFGSLKTPADYRRPKLANVRAATIADLDEADLLRADLADEEYRAAFVERFGLETVLRDAIDEPVIVSLRSFIVNKEKGDVAGNYKFRKAGHGEVIPLLQEMIEEPFEIWLVPQQNAKGQVRLAKRYITLWKTEDKERVAGMMVSEIVDGVFQGITAFAPQNKSGGSNLDYVERQRQGVLIYKR